jgi:hypothetical protein
MLRVVLHWISSNEALRASALRESRGVEIAQDVLSAAADKACVVFDTAVRIFETGHTMRAVLDAVCKVSGIIHCFSAYSRLDGNWPIQSKCLWYFPQRFDLTIERTANKHAPHAPLHNSRRAAIPPHRLEWWRQRFGSSSRFWALRRTNRGRKSPRYPYGLPPEGP